MNNNYFGWSQIKDQNGEVLLKNALHNLSSRENGDSHEFAKGVLVGIVSAFMASGLSFEKACQLAWQLSPKDIYPERIPELWSDEFAGKIAKATKC